jgi:CheY-like chemotaxis protein
VHNDGHGRGAAFTVELPTVAGRDEPAAAVSPQAASARSHVRVLVVDDYIAELLSEALRIEGGPDRRRARRADRAGALAKLRPHAAVLDVGLPEVEGYELTKQVRTEHGPEPTLIAATGYGQPKDRLRAADAGFDCHFVKPVRVRDLVQVLAQRVANPMRGTPPPSP